MAAFLKWGRVAVAAGSVALLSMEAVHLESSKVASSAAEDGKRSAENVTVDQTRPEEVKAAGPQRSKVPKMAPQFDGLNFYETFIGAARR